MTKKSNKIDDLSKKRIAMGERIKEARLANDKMSQAKLAAKLSDISGKDISTQAISYWELGNNSPSTENLIYLAEVLGVSVSSLVEDNYYFKFKTKQVFYGLKNMEDYITKYAKANKFKNTLKAIPFAKKAYNDDSLKNSEISAFTHPLNMACHMLAMDIRDDAIIAATILHDVIEDYDVTPEQLPVDDETKKLVLLMTCPDTHNMSPKERAKVLDKYYAGLRSNPKAALIKLVDRCNNISKMSWGLSKERIYRMANETYDYVLPLLEVIKNTEYDNAKWLLSYQIQTTLDIYRRLM